MGTGNERYGNLLTAKPLSGLRSDPSLVVAMRLEKVISSGCTPFRFCECREATTNVGYHDTPAVPSTTSAGRGVSLLGAWHVSDLASTTPEEGKAAVKQKIAQQPSAGTKADLLNY